MIHYTTKKRDANMVTVSLGARWQKQVDELANAKAHVQELKGELRALNDKYQDTLRELSQAKASAADFKHKYEEALNQLQEARRDLEKTGAESGELLVESATKTRELQKLNTEALGFQEEIDKLSRESRDKTKLLTKLTDELRRSETLRERTEEDRDCWIEKYNKSVHDFEVLQKAKDHSDRHISILVKEKDRIITKRSDPSPILSAKHAIYEEAENSFTSTKTESSWSEVEILRLKSQLKELSSSLSASKQENERLKKENWNLVNRVRNARSK
mmetsp:Transcript_26380/g.47361  ORF Transcript_26380/g.47361 Transcript_26380/m.47361 type:complete len:274 (+) Transcript_26380:1670-2491(+)